MVIEERAGSEVGVEVPGRRSGETSALGVVVAPVAVAEPGAAFELAGSAPSGATLEAAVLAAVELAVSAVELAPTGAESVGLAVGVGDEPFEATGALVVDALVGCDSGGGAEVVGPTRVLELSPEGVAGLVVDAPAADVAVVDRAAVFNGVASALTCAAAEVRAAVEGAAAVSPVA